MMSFNGEVEYEVSNLYNCRDCIACKNMNCDFGLHHYATLNVEIVGEKL